MAETVFNDIVKAKGLDGKYAAFSSAVSTEEIWNGVGSPVDARAKETLFRHGHKQKERRAVLLKKEDYPAFSLFVCMDKSNFYRALRILGNDPENKVVGFDRYIGRDVSDPWYTGDFEKAYSDIYEGCLKLLEAIIKNAV